METKALRLFIRQKLADGRLPRNGVPKVWGGQSNGQQCHACDEFIKKSDFVMEGPVLVGGRSARDVQFHVLCFHMWDDERHSLADSIPRPAPDEATEATAYLDYLILTTPTRQPSGEWGVAVIVRDDDGAAAFESSDLARVGMFTTKATANAAGVLFARAWIDARN